MGLFSKKEDVPEIPAAPVLPELPKQETQPEKKDLPELPSFPSNPRNQDINQEMVKSAVADAPTSPEGEMQVEIPEGLQVTEEQVGTPTIPPVPSIEETTSPPVVISSPPKETSSTAQEPSAIAQNEPSTKQTEPIFVRIDKFQAAQKNFEGIKDKVKEIESVLKRIKDVKSQEEVELKGWTEDVEKIKARLSEVDSSIFNQI